MILTNTDDRAILVEAGKRLGIILDALASAAVPGISTEVLDDMAERLIREGGDEPCFLGYTPQGSSHAYPATLCVSVNEEVVHGIPNESPRTLSAGDIVGLDLGLTHKGLIVDSALTVPVGNVNAIVRSLLNTTAVALEEGMAAAQLGAHIGDISHAIGKTFAKTNFSVVKMLGGHGVGAYVHEEPFIANFGKAGTGEKLVSGMVLALEPIANAGKAAIVLAQDGYTFRTKDGSLSAHFEHTIIIEEGGPVVVTRRPSEK